MVFQVGHCYSRHSIASSSNFANNFMGKWRWFLGIVRTLGQFSTKYRTDRALQFKVSITSIFKHDFRLRYRHLSAIFFSLVFELKKIFRTNSDDYKIIKVCSNEFLCFVLLCSSQSFSWGFLMDFFLCGTSSIAFVIVNRVSVTNRNEEPIEDQSISSKDFIGRSKNRCSKFISQSTFERIGKYTDEYYEI